MHVCSSLSPRFSGQGVQRCAPANLDMYVHHVACACAHLFRCIAAAEACMHHYGTTVCMYACMRVCMYACMRMCMYACIMYALMRVCAYALRSVCYAGCMCMSLFECTHMLACVYVAPASVRVACVY